MIYIEALRPNQEVLFQKKQKNKKPAEHGHLKIFFGYASSVGKTYAMLKAAHAAKQSGIDVVAGHVETQARSSSAALLDELEHIPAKVHIRNGIVISEFDLDAALKRRPQLLLINDLSHTNSGDCRNAKRYQDIEELLSAGIDVYATLTVQHIESMADMAAAITGVSVKEQIPDFVFDNAYQVELVDIEPEKLLNKLKEYPAYKNIYTKHGMQNLYTIENLTMFRELALCRYADRVNLLTENTSGHKRDDYSSDEHILVCLSSAPSDAKIIRTAARMAAAFRGKFTALFVETPDFNTMHENEQKQLRSNMLLAEQLGAVTKTVYGSDVPFQIAEYAHLSGVSQIVVGRSSMRRRHFF